MNKKTVTLTLSPDIIEQGKEQAKTEKRNFSNYVEWLISEDKKRIDKLNEH
jgi:hypothetical protein